MAYTPISGIVPQLSRNAGGAAAGGYYLKGYEAGTTTPLSMGIDSTPTATLAKCKLNTRGEPISNDADETTVFIPHYSENYKLVLYANATDADNNTTANAVWVIDGLAIGLDASTISITINSLPPTSLQSYLENAQFPEFATVADMINGNSQNIGSVSWANYVGRKVYTAVNNATSNAGGWGYEVVTSDPGNLSVLSGGVRVGMNHYLGNQDGIDYYAQLDTTSDVSILACGAVCNADGNAGIGHDDTLALQTIHDQLGYLYLPTDRAPRITSPLNRRSLKIYSDWIDQRGVIGFGGCIVLDDAGATDYDKFLYEPRYLRNLFLLGTSKICTGLAIERGDSISQFLGWARFENVTVSGCKQGVHMGNCFNIQIDHMIIEENEYGFGCDPFNTAGDDGYITTVTLNKLICRQNDQWGLFFNPDLKSPNVAFNNLNIETNNQVGGTYQMLIKNLDPFSGQEWYLEGAETADCFFNNGGNRGEIHGIYQNSCGPFNLTTLTIDLEVSGHKITATGDFVTASGGANHTLKWENSTLLFNGGSLPSVGQLSLSNVTADGVYYNNYSKGSSVFFNQNAIGAATNGYKSITAISESYPAKTIVAGTNNTVISDTFFGGGIMENTVAYARFRGEYQPSLILQVHPRGSDANDDYYRVMAYNFTGTDVVLPGGALDIVFIKTE